MMAHHIVSSSIEQITRYFGSQYILTLLSIGITAIVANAFYNVYLHPLRSYPGPFLGRATVLYSVIWELRGLLHVKELEWHGKYGEVVRVAPNYLSYNSGRAWEKISGYRTSNSQALFEKDQRFFLRSPDGTMHIAGENGEQHRRLRRLMAHAFSDKALKAQEDIIQAYVNQFISQLHKRASSSDNIVDMMHWFNFTTFDIIGDLSFGESFGLMKEGKWSKYLSTLFALMELAAWNSAIRRVFPESWAIFLQTHFVPKKIFNDWMYQYGLAETKLKTRLAMDTERHDFVYYMLKGSKDANGPERLDYNEMATMSQFFIFAGSETTATCLSGLLYYLLKEPACRSRLAHEIRSSFGSESDITPQNIAKLSYLHAVMEEALRLYPPVPNALPRITPEPGQVICDRFVPAGTSVGALHYASYHSSDNFFDPKVFHPERWLDGEDSRFANDKKDVFHPFSLGARNCLGKNLAYAEMKLIVCKLFWNFDVEMQPESENWIDQPTYVLWKKSSLMVKLIAREIS